MPYICRNPEVYESQYKGESHECVAFVKFVANAPQTPLWRPGAPVLGNADIERGTAIACGWEHGAYPSHKHGNHAAIYIGQHAGIIEVWDQGDSEGPVKRRYKIASPDHPYYVIE
jgi:hypothetical protein